MKIGIANDHRGYKLKLKIIEMLEKKGFIVEDEGTDSEESVDYPDYGKLVAEKVSKGEYDRGIVICGSGIGMSIIANKFSGVRAALCYNPVIAKMTRKHNNANVLVLAADYIGEEELEKTLKNFFNTEFDGGRHKRRIEKINKIEKEIKK
ncbi:MAG: ribose 5-phosphate isomerase B [Candidatus Mcinerneyibacterium aminivorans]|uniref:Ribose 5-phosphate isomerase B n=1 Tax=Candidatus Mcinerneyibacterium aminivorans TaxID=2703815 RepID=A0A5D0MFX1_9BACT|nr:MAG: ribose 5-phosphate isomerase B [Candidatus Mcinerneyibacterium aminivorans]